MTLQSATGFSISTTGAKLQGAAAHQAEKMKNHEGTGLSQGKAKGCFRWTKQYELK